jgi:hypothetical protein
MKCEVKGNNLIITLPMNENPEPSKTGKSKIVAGTNGFKDAGVKHPGSDKPISISINAIVK